MAQENPWAAKYGQQTAQPAPRPSAPPVIYGPPETPPPPSELQINSDAREQERLRLAQEQADRTAANQAQSQANEAERLRLAQESAARENAKTTRIPLGDADKLSGNISIFSGFDRTLNTFQDDFGGNLLGSLENLSDSYLGIGTEGQGQWWADFRATDNQIRNELFGATLTPAEQAAYAATSISPGMRPSEIRANLSRRRDIVKGGLLRRRDFLIASGYDPVAVDILFKPVLEGSGVQAAQQTPPTLPPTPTTENTQMVAESGFERMAREGREEENALFFQEVVGYPYESEVAMQSWINSKIGQPLTAEEVDAAKVQFGIPVDTPNWKTDYIVANHPQVGVKGPDGKIKYKEWGRITPESARERAVSQRAAEDPRGEASAGDLLTQGFTLGFSDEAKGVGAGIGAFLQGEDFGDAYTTGRAYEEERLNAGRQRLGGWGTAAELIGGLGSGGGSLRTLGSTGRMAASPIAQGVKAGALGGAVAGTGYSQPGARFEGAVTGGLAGGALGGAIPLTISAARPTYNALLRASGRDKNVPMNQVRNALAADMNTPTSAGRMVQDAQSRGVPMTLADTGDNARALLGSVTRQRGPSKTMGMKAVVERQEGQMERLSEAIRRDLGPTANLQEMGDALMDGAKAKAAPLYEAAYNKPGAGAIFPKLEPLLQRPSVKRALERARRIAAEEGEDPTALGFDLNAQGEVVLTRVPSWKTIDYAKRGLDDVVETYRDRTTGKLVLDTEGRAVNGTLRQLLSIVDKANPEYAAARSAYAGPARMREAMDKGAKAFNKAPDIIKAEMKGMGASEREMYRLGVRKAMVDTLAGKGDYADKVATLSRTPKVRAALSNVFGGGAKVDRFFRTLEDEAKLSLTFKEVATGSPTAQRMAFDATTNDDGLVQEAFEIANTARQGGLFAAVGDILGRVREAGQLGAGKAGDAARESIAALLTEADPAELILIQQAARRAAAKQRLLKGKEVVKARGQGYSTGVGAVTSTENLRAE